jgi:predicted acylesterase/phospholipase RssA
MQKKCLLVGSIGSLKALCTVAGLFYALKEYEFDIAGMVGVSGGSIALPLLSKNISKNEFIKAITSVNGKRIKDQDISQQAIDWIRKTIGLPRNVDLPFTGLLRGNGLRFELAKIYKQFDCETFEKGIIPFSVVATKIAADKSLNGLIINNPNTTFFLAMQPPDVGENENKISKIECVFNKGRVLEPIRGSTAIPLVFRPEIIDDEIYVDGGCVNAIPVLPAIIRYGYEDVFVADATTDIIEEPLYAEDINSAIDVGIATIYAMLRSNTLDKLKLAQQALSCYTKRIIRIKSPCKISMTDTKRAGEEIEKAYDYSIKEISKYFDVKK